MAEITLNESWRQIRALTRRAERAAEVGRWVDAVGRWREAVERWPDLLDDLPADHSEYSQATEARIKRISRHMRGNRLHVTTMTVDGLAAHAAGSGHDPGTGEARSSYAATLLQQGHGLVWPPGRNDRCWCGLDRKYKKRCGPVPATPDAPE